jgi:hypothetical protein
MASYQALGTSPVSFVSNNKQHELPLSAIYFTSNGVDVTSWPLYEANQAILSVLIPQLIAQGFLAAGTSPATPPSLIATAVQAGAAGNSISIKFEAPSITAGTVTMTVSAKQAYTAQTSASLSTALGSSAGAATGLVYVSDPGTGGMPGQLSQNIGSSFDLAVPEAADNSKTAFTLAAADQTDLEGAQLINVAIEPDTSVDPPTAFALTVSWSKSLSVTLASLLTPATNPFSYLITFSGASGPLPAAGTVTLHNGAGSTPASASLLASS